MDTAEAKGIIRELIVEIAEDMDVDEEKITELPCFTNFLKIFIKLGVIEYLDWVELKDGCKDVILSPGYYEISASYFQKECADAGSGCKLDQNLVIEIFDGDVFEIDFEVKLPK